MHEHGRRGLATSLGEKFSSLLGDGYLWRALSVQKYLTERKFFPTFKIRGCGRAGMLFLMNFP